MKTLRLNAEEMRMLIATVEEGIAQATNFRNDLLNRNGSNYDDVLVKHANEVIDQRYKLLDLLKKG